MKTTINKEFFEKWKDKDVAMWCKKKEYAKEFCRLMHRQSLKWCSRRSYLDENSWDFFKEETVYEFGLGSYCNKYFYKNEDYTILDFEDYIVKEKMTKQELVELLEENFINELGDLDLSNLDFRSLDCDVNIGLMKVSGDLFQNCQSVQGNLRQDSQKVQGYLLQDEQEVQKDLYQSNQEVGGKLIQDEVNSDNKNTAKEDMTKGELVDFLVENFTNEYGELDLSDLDFSGYDLDIDISGIKTRGDIYQGEHTTKGSIYQGHHITNKDIYQSDHITKGNIYQLRNKVGGELFQES